MARHARTGAQRHHERHRSERSGWLRAAVLGANDGLLSTAGLVVGVASAGAARGAVLLAGIAGLVAGAFSMAAGEYVSVSSQADAEDADREIEKRELVEDPHGEREELVNIYRRRGLDAELAAKVADQLTAHDALGTHLRDELGLTQALRARPLQAAVTSAITFSVGAALPLLAVALAPVSYMVSAIAVSTLVSLGALGAAGARLGGAPLTTGALRVLFWGALAMVATAAVGKLFGVAV